MGMLRAAAAGVSKLGGSFGQSFAPLRSFRRGLLCNLLNPKVALVLAASAAPFLAGERPAWWPVALWLIIVSPTALLAFWAQTRVKGAFGKWSRYAASSGMTGAQAAQPGQ